MRRPRASLRGFRAALTTRLVRTPTPHDGSAGSYTAENARDVQWRRTPARSDPENARRLGCLVSDQSTGRESPLGTLPVVSDLVGACR